MNELEEVIRLTMSLKKHLLVLGASGIGKTVGVTRLAKELVGTENVITYRGHARTESIELIGMYVRYEDTMVFNDGALTEAFVRAATTPTILIIDEYGRIPASEKDMLIGSLTPDDEGMLILDTGKGIHKDGRFTTEVLKVPVGNLTVIGTSNIGFEYNVDLGDRAGKERFLSIELDSNVNSDIIKMFSTPSVSEELRESMVKVLEQFSNLYNRDMLSGHMNFRLAQTILDLIGLEDVSLATRGNLITSEFNDKYLVKKSSETTELLAGMLGLLDNKLSVMVTEEVGSVNEEEIREIAERMVQRM